MLKTTTENLLRQDGVFIHQEIRDTGHGSASTGNIYNYGIEKEVVDRLLAGKDEEIQHFKDEVKYLKEKIDQLL
jgi:hypothetical protein